MKSYFQTHFEFNPELFGIFEKVTFWFFSFSQYAYFSGCSDVISVGRDLVLESELNVHSNVHSLYNFVQIESPRKISDTIKIC